MHFSSKKRFDYRIKKIIKIEICIAVECNECTQNKIDFFAFQIHKKDFKKLPLLKLEIHFATVTLTALNSFIYFGRKFKLSSSNCPKK